MVVVDASLAVRLVTEGSDSPLARTLWRVWVEQGTTTHAPPLFWPETMNAIWQYVRGQHMTLAAGQAALQALRGLKIEIVEPPDLYDRAWILTSELRLPAIYDSCYLALAELLGLEFWTADERLYNTVRSRFNWVKSLATDAPA